MISVCLLQVVKSLKDSAWTAVEQSKVAGTQKMNELMDTRVGMVVASTVDAALQLSDMAVDYCLPDEKSEFWCDFQVIGKQ